MCHLCLSGINSWLECSHEELGDSHSLYFFAGNELGSSLPRAPAHCLLEQRGLWTGTGHSYGSMNNGVIHYSLQQQVAWFWTVVGWLVCVLHILTYTHMLTCIFTLTHIGHLQKHAHTYSHLCKHEFTHEQHKHICYTCVHTQAHVCTWSPGIFQQ